MKEDKRPSWDGHPLHMDASFSSQLLNLRVSFFWRHLANELLIDTFRTWITPPYNSTPDFIFMGNLMEIYYYKRINWLLPHISSRPPSSHGA